MPLPSACQPRHAADATARKAASIQRSEVVKFFPHASALREKWRASASHHVMVT